MSLIKKLRALKDPKSGGEKRSPGWPAARKAYLEREPFCQACGKDKQIEVHHCVPFHKDPSLELDENNFISLCEGNKSICCHRLLGHLGNYKDDNPNVRKDAAYINKMLNSEKPEEGKK